MMFGIQSLRKGLWSKSIPLNKTHGSNGRGTRPDRFSLVGKAWKKRKQKAEIDSFKKAEHRSFVRRIKTSTGDLIASSLCKDKRGLRKGARTKTAFSLREESNLGLGQLYSLSKSPHAWKIKGNTNDYFVQVREIISNISTNRNNARTPSILTLQKFDLCILFKVVNASL
jgi:hypothetical protein